MKKSSYIIIIVALATVGCRNAKRNSAQEAEPVKLEQVASIDKNSPDKQMTALLEEATLLPSKDGVANLVLSDGSRKFTIRKTAGEKVFADFPADGYKHLHAVVAPVGTGEANLRISMIRLPDGTTDGPFGREIDRDIPSSGTIRLEIGESLMQGDEWGGDFTLDVKLTK